jgi:HEPN domain-containing protein
VRGAFSLTPEESEEAGRLLTAPGADLRAAKVLAADSDQADAVIGFHAQQAVEKAIKAVLMASGVDIPRSHDLSFLVEIIQRHAIIPPDGVARADWLTPWAVAARYGAADAPLDREMAVSVASEAVGWATTVLSPDSR